MIGRGESLNFDLSELKIDLSKRSKWEMIFFAENNPSIMQERNSVKPFIKWAGGKGQLLRQLDSYLPTRLRQEPFTYIEPFVGGGAMLFHVLHTMRHVRRAVINDVNEDLVKAYRTVRDSPGRLIDELGRMEAAFLATDDESRRKDLYVRVRDEFNAHHGDDILNTAYLMFLNKTCFNGLYRVNRKGWFNVPIGRYKHPVICNAQTILADSNLLRACHVEIMSGDFERMTDRLTLGELTFVYLDPPYRPLNATSSFTSYAMGDFGDDDQRRLAAFCQWLDAAGCLWMQSNADCSARNPNDRFFEQLYADCRIERVYASRSINSNPAKRGKLTELLIHNDYQTNKTLFQAV